MCSRCLEHRWNTPTFPDDARDAGDSRPDSYRVCLSSTEFRVCSRCLEHRWNTPTFPDDASDAGDSRPDSYRVSSVFQVTGTWRPLRLSTQKKMQNIPQIPPFRNLAKKKEGDSASEIVPVVRP